MKWVNVTQLCLTLCDPMDWILQARILEWVAFPFSRGSSQSRDQTQVSCIAGGFFTSWTTREALGEEGWLFSLWLQSSCLLKKTCWFSICSDLFLVLRMTVPKLFTFWVEIGRFILVYIFFLLLRLNNLNWPIFKSSSSFFCLLKSFVEPLQWIFFFPLFSYFALVL